MWMHGISPHHSVDIVAFPRGVRTETDPSESISSNIAFLAGFSPENISKPEAGERNASPFLGVG